MQHITVAVQDHEKAQLLYSVLQSLDFVMHISTDDEEIHQQHGQDTTDHVEEFFSYAGLWSDRDISISTLRQRAWPRQSA
jgi:hypothetical protein